jgi:hypothetical protein
MYNISLCRKKGGDGMGKTKPALTEKTGKELILGLKKGGWVNCRICEKVKHLRRETRVYCNECEDAFCPEHGTFREVHGGICVRCFKLD